MLVGRFGGTLDFGPGAPPLNAGNDAFVAKLSPTGQHLWSRALGGSVAPSAATAVAIDADDRIVVVGVFEGITLRAWLGDGFDQRTAVGFR